MDVLGLIFASYIDAVSNNVYNRFTDMYGVDVQAQTVEYAYTGAIRTSIPALSGHPFRFNPDTDSGISQPVFC